MAHLSFFQNIKSGGTMGRVTGRSCIVTGAAQGIGRAIGEALLHEGADV
ncbi:MAG: hypothetical protein ACI853_002005, partial [Paracoccaceae bacterium]